MDPACIRIINRRSFVCPITGARIRKAVYVDDEASLPGFHVYERGALEEWAKLNGGKEVPMPSGERRNLDANRLRSIRVPLAETAPMGICRLGAVFDVLDGIHDVLSSSLERREFQPPRVVVVGPENMGKSSLLNRLCGLPLFPKNDGTCTIMPILVRLRRCQHGEARTSIAIKSANGSLVDEEPLVPMFLVQETVLAAMQKHAAQRMTYTVELNVRHPNVPPLDLVDLPGLCVNTSQERNATSNLVNAQLRLANPHSFFLFTHRAIDEFANNPAIEALAACQMMPRSVGVFTCCDLAMSDGFKKYVQTIKSLVAGEGQPAPSSAPPVGRGWVATMTLWEEGGSTSSHAPDAISLIAKANKDEAEEFKASGRQFGPLELHGVNALLGKLVCCAAPHPARLALAESYELTVCTHPFVLRVRSKRCTTRPCGRAGSRT